METKNSYINKITIIIRIIFALLVSIYYLCALETYKIIELWKQMN